MTEQRADDLKKSANGETGMPTPPASNQGKDEPVARTPENSAQTSEGEASAAAGAGSASRAAAEQGDLPRELDVDNERSAANTAEAATMPASATGGVPTPGDSKGVSVPAVQATLGTSEEAESVEGVRITALAPPGKPDGEVDTRG